MTALDVYEITDKRHVATFQIGLLHPDLHERYEMVAEATYNPANLRVNTIHIVSTTQPAEALPDTPTGGLFKSPKGI